MKGRNKVKELADNFRAFNIGITMNLYIHITEEEKVKEVEKKNAQNCLKMVW